MSDPTTDPVTISMSSAALTYILGRIIYDVKKYWNNKNGNNPHSQSIKKLFEYHDQNVEKFGTIKEDVAVLKNNVDRIYKKLDELSK